jgi:ABC-type cobalamin transport system permease subunit
MKTRFLLAICLSLIVGSVFLAPGTTWLGVNPVFALDLSRILLVMGILAAVLTVDAEARELREHKE